MKRNPFILLSRALIVSWVLLAAACGQLTPTARVETVSIPGVGQVELLRAIDEPESEQLLDVGVVIFSNQPAAARSNELGAWIFNEIRENETQYLPYVLRNTLLQSNLWGAVRVLPDIDPSQDLAIEGRIIQSDGINLELHIVATDSSGREWINKTYRDVAGAVDYPESTRYTPKNRFQPTTFIDPFQDLYNQINNDLVVLRNGFTPQQLADIKHVSAMVYASDLSPETFAHTLSNGPDGLLTVTSLLAEDDPMVERLAEMRLRHHVFIDTVDEYYQSLFDEMRPVYVTWRHYSRDQLIESASASRAIYEGDGYGNARNFLNLSQRYDRFRWSKIYEQEFTQLATGFNNEIAPAILELNRSVHGMTGNLEDHYAQWRDILRDLFAVEISGVPVN